MRARALFWLAAILLLAAPLSCGPQPTPGPTGPGPETPAPASPGAGAGETIKIVSSLPMTGSSLVQTETIVNAIKMALEEENYRADGFKIEYEAWDDASAQAGSWDPGKEKENATRAAGDPDIMVYIGTFNSGAAKIAIPILNRANLVMISPANTYVGLTKDLPGLVEKGEPAIYYPTGKRNYCRVVPADDLQAKAAAWWANQMGVQKVYILDDKEVYGKGIANAFESECKALGIQVLGHEGIDAKAPDFRAVMNKVKGTHPDLVYFGGITQNGAGKLVKDMREVGLKAKFMGPDGIKETAFLESAGAAAEGVYVTMGSMDPKNLTGKARDWYNAYKQKFGKEPEAYAIYGYEAAKVALDAIKRAGKKDREAIRQALMNTKDYHGVLGTWSFDANGDTTLKVMSGFVVKGGKFEFVQALLSEEAPGGSPQAAGSPGESPQSPASPGSSSEEEEESPAVQESPAEAGSPAASPH
jgi:branched-chain amino acid transport system substrate-binding protein